MAGIVTALSYEYNSVIGKVGTAGVFSKGRGNNSSIIRAYGKDSSGIVLSEDEISSYKGDVICKALFFTTKNEAAKKKSD